jgi:Eco57I restriction-modification methylase
MIPGLSGSLLSHDALAGALADISRAATRPNYRWFYAWHNRIVRDMGPTSPARHVYDRVALPLALAIGLRVVPTVTRETGGSVHGLLYKDGLSVAALIATGWGRDPSSAWQDAVRTAIAHGLKWAIVITGPFVRVFDATHTYSRRFIQFDLEITVHDPTALEFLCALLGAEGFSESATALDHAVLLSERHRASVRSSLQAGVHDGVISLLRAFAAAHRRHRHTSLDSLFEESLVVIYRILFLLFAEARGLVPKWHPTYRDSYTIESLREPTERLARPAGLWESIQAIARLAHHGCRAGSLHVPPFNGRLFSPRHAPLADSLALDDAAVREAILSLTTVQRGPVRRRIAYADLGVEQLGGVYERILDYAPALSPGRDGSLTLKRIGRRKATGTYYTPRALTEFLVRRAFAPLVKDASAEKILSLRVVDPAMGSGAFLVAVCRYLAAAYESALIRDGAMSSDGVTEGERAAFRRVIAQRCLFGVDVNPMAVQLARLSLWLATLARDKPLTFLDHHLRVGNSLAGASIEDVVRRPGCNARAPASRAQLPLFDLDRLDRDMTTVIATRLSLALAPDDRVEQVRTKERLLASLQSDSSPLTPWQRIANLWCAHWFSTAGRPGAAKAFAPLVDEILGRARVLPAHLSQPILDHAQRVAARERFFHWQFEFPEVFLDGAARGAQAGFDAVIGNPPWEVLHGDGKSPGDTALTTFSRQSGTYRWQGEGHANLYQLFLERALAVTRAGGRIAMVVPSGFALDHGCARLRSALLDRTSVDTFVTVENREALFPIHRGLKFLLVAATRGERTMTIPCRSGIRSRSDLERIPDLGDDSSIDLPRSVVEQFSGEQLAIPEIRSRNDVGILGGTVFRFPGLSSAEGWNVRFGRELNATDDREHFVERRTRGCLPVLEGKQIQPFIANVGRVTRYIRDTDASRLLRSNGFRSARLAYRDVASASNRLTLIAAIVPANVVTTHTLFCLKGDVPHEVQLFLCGIFNSFVANYLVRMRVGTHVTVAIMERLRVPRPSTDSPPFLSIVALTNRVTTTPSDERAAAEIQAAVARLYQLNAADFQHVLDMFPLVPLSDRRAAMQCFLEQ